jgi:signal transduction histidine kinase
VFSRLQLLEAIQGTAYEGYERTIDAHIKNLRAKLELDPRQPRYIETVFGVGYRFHKAVAIASMALIATTSAAGEVRMFMAGGGMMGLDVLAQDLEASYRRNENWSGAQQLLDDYRQGHGMGGMMGGGAGNGSIHLRLADAAGNVLADNQAAPQGRLTRAERENAVELKGSGGALVGYLVASGAVGNANAERLLLQRLLRASLLAAVIAGGLSLLLALLLSYSLLRPVKALTQAAARMTAGDLSQRVTIRGQDELATLGQAFNRMAASLQHAQQSRRAMTADIAHELRTPIAVQRAHLEALQDGIYPLTVDNLQPVLESTDLLTRLVEDLRTLALADAGELGLERAPGDLALLVGRVVERFRPRPKAGRLTWCIKMFRPARPGRCLWMPGASSRFSTTC